MSMNKLLLDQAVRRTGTMVASLSTLFLLLAVINAGFEYSLPAAPSSISARGLK
jgi:hypothetical protein